MNLILRPQAAFLSLALVASPFSIAAAEPPPAPPRPPALITDPVTGLPAPAPVWIDPAWKDPGKKLPAVNLDGLHLHDVVGMLQKEFDGAFDVLIPKGWEQPSDPALSVDPQGISIRMQLKNVTASEIFNAMNILFEAENAPFRWELKLNGNRPTAILRILPHLLRPTAAANIPPPQSRMVFFVGDLIGEAKTGRMTVERLHRTLTEIYAMSYGEPKGVLQFHAEAQVLILKGTSHEIEFVQQTLLALREKAQADQRAKGHLQ